MTTAADQITKHIPETKKDRVELALDLLKYGIKADQRAWNKTRLAKADPADLDALIVRLAERARKGRVTHLPALAGVTTACRVERDASTLPAADLIITPFAYSGDETTCKGCREAAGLPTPEEYAAFLAAEEEQIAAEMAAPTPAPKASKRGRGRPNSSGAVNAARFATLAVDGAIALTATYKGETFTAYLVESGEVTVGETTHASLSRAACAVRQTKTCNGWRFWRLDANGEHADWLRHADDETTTEAAA